jgi:hypothetical protein
MPLFTSWIFIWGNMVISEGVVKVVRVLNIIINFTLQYYVMPLLLLLITFLDTRSQIKIHVCRKRILEWYSSSVKTTIKYSVHFYHQNPNFSADKILCFMNAKEDDEDIGAM